METPTTPAEMACVASPATMRGGSKRHNHLLADSVECNPAFASTTPAEARTGISDRTAAALADVADLRRSISSYMLETRGESARDRSFAALDRIEQALRAGGAA